ncbi:MAG: hypothetical protein IT366_05075 [Candidatus Hydrogenedentes bacterium]|nr:hypothetical protein [Candidatus Hydrogenedentota bacterium]
MKALLFPLSQVLAHVSRAYVVGRELRARGHEVVFAAENLEHTRSQMSIVAQDGFRIVDAREPDFSYLWRSMMESGFRGTVGAVCSPKKWMPVDKIIESQVEIIKNERPDVVVGFATATMSNAAYIAGVPAANVYNAYYIGGILSRPIWRFYWHAYDAVFLAAMRSTVYKRHGKKNIPAIDLFRSVPLLSPDLPQMYEVGSALYNAQMTGPILFDYPAPAPEWMNELDDGTPNVYITMGSTGVVYDAVRASFGALARLPYRFIVTTGGQVNHDALGDIPGNFRVTAFAPGDAILARSHALVFHGGNGSMYQALQHGVPMLAIPTHNEQRINARIAERHGFCRLLEFKRARNGELRDAIVSLVENEPGRDAAQRMAELVRASNGAATIADQIEHIARNRL